MRQFGITSNLPENIFLAIVGGIIGFIGICVIHLHDRSASVNVRKSKYDNYGSLY
jgi:hypothetical protein